MGFGTTLDLALCLVGRGGIRPNPAPAFFPVPVPPPGRGQEGSWGWGCKLADLVQATAVLASRGWTLHLSRTTLDFAGCLAPHPMPSLHPLHALSRLQRNGGSFRRLPPFPLCTSILPTLVASYNPYEIPQAFQRNLLGSTWEPEVPKGTCQIVISMRLTYKAMLGPL